MGNSLVSGREVSAGGIMNGAPEGVMTNTLSTGGDQISGKWTNVRTGVTVYARQMIDNGNEALIVTDKGVIPMSEFVEFVQINEEEYVNNDVEPIKTDWGSVKLNNEDNELLSNLSNVNLSNTNLSNVNQPQLPSLDKPLTSVKSTPTISHQEMSVECTNYNIIDKLFSKFDNTISISVNLDWGAFPKDKIETLIEIFDVPKDDIIEYIIKKYLTIDNIKQSIQL